jgi:anti-anti-sigma regulatory factor
MRDQSPAPSGRKLSRQMRQQSIEQPSDSSPDARAAFAVVPRTLSGQLTIVELSGCFEGAASAVAVRKCFRSLFELFSFKAIETDLTQVTSTGSGTMAALNDAYVRAKRRRVAFMLVNVLPKTRQSFAAQGFAIPSRPRSNRQSRADVR